MRRVKFVDLGRQYMSLRNEILAAVDAVSARGDYILGREVREFERSFAEFCGAGYAVAVGNGSDALYLILEALGIGPGDEVVTAPNSFVASAWVIARTGARIVFCDVRDDMNIDPALLDSVITDRTKAILPVHLTGRIADMNPILEIAGRRNVHVVEDAAQAVGAVYRSRKAGSFGVAAGFSLHPLKNLHVHGDGGIITTDDAELSEKLCQYRNHGLRGRDECEFWGINSRLDTIQAAIGQVKLRHIDRWNARFRDIARKYSEQLAEYVDVPGEHDYEQPVYHRYMIKCEDRDGLQRFLAGWGVETKVNYPSPLHLLPAARSLGYRKGDFPVAERLAGTILSLPVYAELEDEEVEYVICKVIEYMKSCCRT